MLSNISSLRIVEVLGYQWEQELLYQLTFTLRDLIHKKSDKAALHIVCIVVMNLLMFIVFFIVSKLPADMLDKI